MTVSEFHTIADRIDSERPIPTRPSLSDLVIGAAAYAVIVVCGVVARLRRG